MNSNWTSSGFRGLAHFAFTLLVGVGEGTLSTVPLFALALLRFATNHHVPIARHLPPPLSLCHGDQFWIGKGRHHRLRNGIIHQTRVAHRHVHFKLLSAHKLVVIGAVRTELLALGSR